MKKTIREHFSRIAMMLLLMLLTATTAWAVDVTSSTTNWTNGNTYTVTSDVTINTRISVSGTVTLNLGAGTTLTLNQGIDVSGGNWLTITGDGTLIVHGPNGADGYNDADGGDGGSGVNGNLIINSGTVTITGGNGGNSLSDTGNEGLGGSGGAGVKGNLIVNGGTVTVNGSDGGVGFMPAPDGNGIDGSLTLNGGTVTINIGRNLGGWFVGITGDITLAGGTLVFPNIDSRVSCAFDYDRNVVIDGHIYKYIYENSVGYLTGSLDDDQKKDLCDKPLTLLPVPFVGEGTEGDPYLITSYNDLLNLRDFVNSGTSSDGKYFKQTTDIDWPANTTWTSGSGTDAAHRFGGHYDGDGNAIRHLTITGTSKYTALFGYVCGASNGMGGSVLTTLKNIVLEDCNIDASSVSGSYASGICAFINSISYTRIDNCRVSGTISGASYASGIICNNSSSTYVTNCFADVTVNATHKGKIFASIGTTYGNDKVVGNYYHDNGDGVGVGYSNNLTASQVAPLYTVSGTNLTAAATNATVTHAGTHYFASGATVTLTTDGSHIISGTPTVSGTGASLGSVASDKKSMTITVGTADVTVTATWYDLALFGYDDDPLVDGSTNHPYVISTTDGWNLLCDCLNDNTTWNRFSGKTVKLDANIEVSRMAGSDSHDFCGTFDGQGYTLTFNHGTSSSYANVQYVAPFSYVSNTKANTNDAANCPATIKNLHVKGDIYTSAKYAAGIVGQHWGTLNIENCRSSIVIHSSVSGDGTHGGFEAISNGVLKITGCVFDGKLLTTTATTNCGGFVGWRAAETITISNSYYVPATLADGETEVLTGDINKDPSATFVRNGSKNTNITDCQYTRALGTVQGQQLSYRYYDTTDRTYKTAAVPEEATVVTKTDNYTTSDWGSNGTETWFVIDGAVTRQNNLGIYGTVNLVLCNGATFGGNNAVNLLNNATLNIYAQTDDANTMGQLSAKGDYINRPAIGPYSGNNGTTVNIHGGKINATGVSNWITHTGCAAIGGAYNSPAGHINIYGGNISAEGSTYAVALGGSSGGNICIHGGQVSAIGKGDYGVVAIKLDLSWTNVNDRIYFSSYRSDVYSDGVYFDPKHSFMLSGTNTVATKSNISGHTLVPVLVLNDADNSSAITDHNGDSCPVILNGRTLYKDGTWNTLCLPFEVTAAQLAEATHPLYGATIMELDVSGTYDTDKQTGFDAASGTLNLYFKEATSIEAGRPYIIKWATTGDNLVSPVFSGVTITAAAPTAVTSEDGRVTYMGSYAPVALATSDLLIGSGNTLQQPAADGTQLNVFRAYLSIPASIGLEQLTDAVLGKVEPTAASDVNGDLQTDILDITALIDDLPGHGLVKRVVSNVGLGLGH